MSKASGGTFRSGFYSGAFGSFAGSIGATFLPKGGGFGGFSLRVSFSATAGGVGSVLGGGKFAIGAITGAFVQIFNHESHIGVEIAAYFTEIPIANASAHALVVGTDLATGETYATRLGPGEWECSGLPCATAVTGAFNEGFTDKPSEVVYKRKLGVLDWGMEDFKSHADSFADSVNKLDIPYRLTTQNSNGYASAFSLSLGLGRITSPPGYALPGAGNTRPYGFPSAPFGPTERARAR